MLTRRSLLSMLSAGIASVAVSTRLAASELRVVGEPVLLTEAEAQALVKKMFDNMIRMGVIEIDDHEGRIAIHDELLRQDREGPPVIEITPMDSRGSTWELLEVDGHDARSAPARA